METRANHLWVGVVTLLLLAALAAFIVWLARLGQGDQREYDIFFQQSVSGLATGSQVAFAGVPVGQISDIALSEEDPEFVRVRIKVKDGVPVLVGTTATIQASFTGVSTILLDGARKNAPAITCETTACPEGRPVIPPQAGGFGQILASAPVLLERVATLTERLTELLSDRNQGEIAGILKNSNAITAELAETGPQIRGTLAALEGTLGEAQTTLGEASQSLDAFEQVTRSSDKLLNQEGAALAEKLRGTLDTASKAADALSTTLNKAQPAADRLNNDTLPQVEELLLTTEKAVRDMQATSKALRQVTERVEREGASSIISSPALPDYKPK